MNISSDKFGLLTEDVLFLIVWFMLFHDDNVCFSCTAFIYLITCKATSIWQLFVVLLKFFAHWQPQFVVTHNGDLYMQNIQWTALMAAAGCGSTNVVRTLLEHGANVNDVTLKTFTCAAHEAAKNGHLQVLRVSSLWISMVNSLQICLLGPSHK